MFVPRSGQRRRPNRQLADLKGSETVYFVVFATCGPASFSSPQITARTKCLPLHLLGGSRGTALSFSSAPASFSLTFSPTFQLCARPREAACSHRPRRRTPQQFRFWPCRKAASRRPLSFKSGDLRRVASALSQSISFSTRSAPNQGTPNLSVPLRRRRSPGQY